MKKRFAIILTAAALSMTGCSLLGQDTYYIDQGMEQINSGNYEEALTSFSSAEQEGKPSRGELPRQRHGVYGTWRIRQGGRGV